MLRRKTTSDQSTWKSRQTIQYRIIGGIFLLMGGSLVPFSVLHSPPWWFHCLLLGLLLPGLVAVTASDGVKIDADAGKVTRW